MSGSASAAPKSPPDLEGKRVYPGAAADAEPTAVIRGQVFDDDGKPLDNIQVEAFAAGEPNGDPVASDLTYEYGDVASHGAYELHVPAGTYRVRLSSPDWADVHVYGTVFYGGGAGDDVTVADDDVVTLDDVTLFPEHGVSVSGVVHGTDDAPLANARVQLIQFHDDNISYLDEETTDESGAYTFEGVHRSRSYTVRVDGLVDADYEFRGLPDVFLGQKPTASLADRVTVPTDSDGETVPTITLVRGTNVHGVVATAGGAIPGYVVSAFQLVNDDGSFDWVRAIGTPSSDGQFESRLMPGYDYTVGVSTNEDEWDELTYLGDTIDAAAAKTFTLSNEDVDLGTITTGVGTAKLHIRVVDQDGEAFDRQDVEVQVLHKVGDAFEVVGDARATQDGDFVKTVFQGEDYTVAAVDWANDTTTFLGDTTDESQAETVRADAGQATLDAGLITISSGTTRLKVTGTVLTNDGAGITGAAVRLIGFREGCPRCTAQLVERRTDSEGRYSLPVPRLAPYNYTSFTVYADGDSVDRTRAYLGDVTRRKNADRFVVADADLAVAPVHLATLQGVVRGSLVREDGSSFDQAANVSLWRWYGFGEGNGYWQPVQSTFSPTSDFRFDHVSAGFYAISASTQSISGVTYAGSTAPDGALPTGSDVPGAFFVDGGTPTHLEPITMRVPATIDGHVTLADGAEIADGSVWLSIYRWSADAGQFQQVGGVSTNAADGAYSSAMAGLPAGTYAVQATYFLDSGDFSGYHSAWSTGTYPTTQDAPGLVTVGSGESVTVDLELGKLPTVTGRVVDEQSGDPVDGVPVTLYGHCPWSDGCTTIVGSTTTADDGTYEFIPDQSWEWIDFDAVTVHVEGADAGYQDRWANDVDVSAGVTFEDLGPAEIAFDDIHLQSLAGVVKGRLVPAPDGPPLGDYTTVSLFRWDDTAQDFVYAGSQHVTGARYVFGGVEPGSYAVDAVTRDYDDTTSYLTTWLGGARPTGPDGAGVIVVSDPSTPVRVPDITMDRGIELSGTVRSPDGTPIERARLEFTYPDHDSTRFAYSDEDGRYAVRVPADSPVWFSAYHAGFGYTDHGTGPDDAPITTGADDSTYDIELAPQWGDIGAVAGEQQEYCLSHEWAYSPIEFAGEQLRISGGRIFLDDLWPDGPLADSEVPVLAPLGDDWTAYFTSWGVSPDGQTLCVQWGGDGVATYQALLTKSDDGGLDVVYNYDTVPWTPSDEAGYADGLGESVIFPDGADQGYADGGAGALIEHSLDSDQPGRYAFHFRGFAADAGAPQTDDWPRILGHRYVGETLTADPGQWTVNGEPAVDATYTYRWLRGGKTRGTGATYQVAGTDSRKRIQLDVRVTVPGHRAASASTSVRIHAGAFAAILDEAPSLSPASPEIGDTITLDPGAWTAADGLTQDDLTFSYRWFRDGQRITGAAGTTYTATDADELSQITARVLVSAPDKATVSKTTNAVQVAEKRKLAAAVAPTLTGEPKVGETLTVDPGEWDDEDVTVTYEWYVNYRQRATGSTYTLTTADKGNIVTVVVTARAPGRRDGTWSTTVGPVAATAAQLVPLTVHVKGDADAPLAGVYVSVCEHVTWTCLPGDATDANGDFKSQAVAGTTYVVDAYPSAPYRTASSPVTVGTSAASVTLTLTQPAPPPPNVSIPTSNGTVDGTTPMVHWQDAQDFRVTGCADVTDPTYTVTFTDGTEPRTGALTRGEVDGDGLATYSATIPAFYPSHGDITISTNVPSDCEDGTEPTKVSVYIDPSGVVTDQYGRPIEGATVTLLRSDNAGGPFAQVPDGSDIMSAANRTNPDTTDDKGFFQWDVSAGWYRVKATAPGCSTASTDPMDVPPPRIDLLIKLTCTAPAPTATVSVTGTSKVGQTLTASTGSWGDLTTVTNQWLRDGTPIAGADKATYVLTASDFGRQVSVKQTAQRPTYVQDSGRGVPVTFSSASAASSAVTVAKGDAPTAAKPTLTGASGVGETLTAPEPAWSLTGVSTTRQWKVGGVAVDNQTGTTYEVRPADVGKAITVSYVGTKAGYADGAVDSESVTGALGTQLTPTAKPGISGTPKVGSTLTASQPTWSKSGVTTSAPRWRVAGAPIVGENGTTYVVKPGDVGKAITVAYTGTKDGYADGTATSDPVTALLGDAPVVDTRPTITGEAKSGATLTAAPPTWKVEGVTTSAPQWAVGGVPVDGETGTTYVVRPGDVGRSITVTYKGTKTGYADGTATSLPFAIPAPGGGGGGSGGGGGTPSTMTATTAPVISGAPKVGSTLSASAPVWSVEGVTTSAPHWTVGGATVPAAADGSYTVRAGDVGQPIQVTFTGQKTGYTEGVATSEAVTAQLGDAAEAVQPPVVSGEPIVGSTLTAATGTWSVDGLEFELQWLRGGEPVEGATGDSYVVSREDLGSSLTVRVTASRDGYADGTAESAPVEVGKLASTTSAKAANRVVKLGKRVAITATVTVPGMDDPKGRLVLRVDGKAYRTFALTSAQAGTRTMHVAHLKRGRHTLSVAYAGNDLVEGSRSRGVTVRVVKRPHHGGGHHRVAVPTLW